MKTLLLSFALVCSGVVCGQYHPYGDRDGPPPWPDSFGEKLHYLCSSRGPLDMRERQWLEELLLRFRENSEAVFKILDLAPNDKYLSRLVNSVSQSNLDQSAKSRIYRIAYQRSVANSGWNLTLARILDHAEILTEDEMRSHLNAESADVRRAAEQALQRFAVRKRQMPPANNGGGTRTGRGDRPPNSPVVATDSHGENYIRMGLAAGTAALAAALGWWFWRRHTKQANP